MRRVSPRWNRHIHRIRSAPVAARTITSFGSVNWICSDVLKASTTPANRTAYTTVSARWSPLTESTRACEDRDVGRFLLGDTES
jgi:hypothetical protein